MAIVGAQEKDGLRTRWVNDRRWRITEVLLSKDIGPEIDGA